MQLPTNINDYANYLSDEDVKELIEFGKKLMNNPYISQDQDALKRIRQRVIERGQFMNLKWDKIAATLHELGLPLQ